MCGGVDMSVCNDACSIGYGNMYGGVGVCVFIYYCMGVCFIVYGLK